MTNPELPDEHTTDTPPALPEAYLKANRPTPLWKRLLWFLAIFVGIGVLYCLLVHFAVFHVSETTRYSDSLRKEMEERWNTTIPPSVEWKQLSKTQYRDTQFDGYFVATEEDFRTMFPPERFQETSIVVTAEETRDILAAMYKLIPEYVVLSPETLAKMAPEDRAEQQEFSRQMIEQRLRLQDPFFDKAFPWLRTGSDSGHTLLLLTKDDIPGQKFRIHMERDTPEKGKCTFYVSWNTY